MAAIRNLIAQIEAGQRASVNLAVRLSSSLAMAPSAHFVITGRVGAAIDDARAVPRAAAQQERHVAQPLVHRLLQPGLA